MPGRFGIFVGFVLAIAWFCGWSFGVAIVFNWVFDAIVEDGLSVRLILAALFLIVVTLGWLSAFRTLLRLLLDGPISGAVARSREAADD